MGKGVNPYHQELILSFQRFSIVVGAGELRRKVDSIVMEKKLWKTYMLELKNVQFWSTEV